MTKLFSLTTVLWDLNITIMTEKHRLNFNKFFIYEKLKNWLYCEVSNTK